MRERVAAFDWSATPLGPRAQWPSELEIAVGQMLDSSFPKAIVWGPEFTTIHNDAFLPILGQKPSALGRSFADIWAEVWDTIGPILKRAYCGEPTYIEDFPLTIDRSGRGERVWFTFCYSPLRLADGTVAGMLDTVVETTEKVRAQEELALVNQELGHRLKNTMSLVQAIASRTLREAAEPDAMEAFNARIGALGHAHEILLKADWSAASLEQVIRASIEPHDALDQVRAEGADMKINPRAAVSLSLMIHELATNAVKYGALSVPSGKVRAAWNFDENTLHFSWCETDGPLVIDPTGQGFGSRLIDIGLGRKSIVDHRFESSGLKLEIRAPLHDLT
jgi:Signal transduction histidine kinase